MSLDTLFQKIILTEQQISEKSRQLQEVKVAITRCEDMIKSRAENNKRDNENLEEKAQQLTHIQFQYELMRKSQDQMEKQNNDLLQQQNHLKARLDEIKRQSREEKENFIREIQAFNNDFNLLSNRKSLLKSQTQSEIQELEKDISTLNQEMEYMTQSDSRVKSMQEEKRALYTELQEMQRVLTDLDGQLCEARAVTEALRAESVAVSQKPLSDNTCLRLKKQLEVFKEDELELLREALISERQFLQSVMTLIPLSLTLIRHH
ncbi:coiled-coil domain-containing protein 172 isoform X1 [Osmerus eperlanus]|uniref:coiled-coil domain-containing protein 172 isoform X1 n=2 Tax=Osmerus eperlanus TaxID=29151 RepID=UPI002E12A06C